VASALRKHGIEDKLETVGKPSEQESITALPKRWIFEWTFAWLGRCRRLSKDCESAEASSLAWTHLAACRHFVRRIARARVKHKANHVPA